MFVFYDSLTGRVSFTVQGKSYPPHLVQAGISVLEAYLPEDAQLAAWRVANGELTYTRPQPTNEDVNAERDRRLYATFTFQGVEYDCDHVSLARITGAATLAGFAIAAGAPAGYLRWHGGDADFMWIAHDNSLIVMDAQTVFSFGRAAAENQSAHVLAADVLKRQNPIPDDYADEVYWP